MKCFAVCCVIEAIISKSKNMIQFVHHFEIIKFLWPESKNRNSSNFSKRSKPAPQKRAIKRPTTGKTKGIESDAKRGLELFW